MLNWLDNEKKRDNLEEKSYKNKILKEIKGLNKNELFKRNVYQPVIHINVVKPS